MVSYSHRIPTLEKSKDTVQEKIGPSQHSSVKKTENHSQALQNLNFISGRKNDGRKSDMSIENSKIVGEFPKENSKNVIRKPSRI